MWTNTAGYDQRFQHLIEAFIFDSGSILGRDANFLARERAPIFKAFLDAAVSRGASDRLQVEFTLPAAAYDFESETLRFKPPHSGAFLEEIDLLPRTKLKLGEEIAKVAYDPNAYRYIVQKESAYRSASGGLI